MKRVIMLSALAGALVCGNALANPATVNFTGDVQSGTCTLSADSKNATVAMPDISYAEFADNSMKKDLSVAPYVISFVNCPASVTAVHLDSSSSTGNPPGVNGCSSAFGGYCPESGTTKGMGLKVNKPGVSSSTNGDTMFPYTTVSSNDFPVQPDGSVTINSTVVAGGNVLDEHAPGWYATTFTFNFSWT